MLGLLPPEFVSDRLHGFGTDRDHVDPREWLRDPVSHDGRCTSGGEFTGNGVGHEGATIEAPKKVRVVEQDEVSAVERCRRDDEHRRGRMPSSRCAERPSQRSASEYRSGT